jgi:hypothetical protein
VVPTPDELRAEGDPGDDTARRFAYQYTYAAVLACGLLDDTLGISELFCEHHEDVLLKHSDGTLSGIQIKTRDLGQDPWKATDRAILGALSRFVSLEHRFPGQFREFVIATNHSFLAGKGTRTDLPHVLLLARSAPDESQCETPLRELLAKLASASSCPTSVVLVALKKCRADDALPKLTGIKKELASAIAENWPHASELSHLLLSLAADALSAECGRASCLDHEQCLPGYLSALPGGAAISAQAVIAGKRIDRRRLETVLRAAVDAPSLLTGPPTSTLPSSGDTAVLETKLSAGGFSIVSMHSAKDLRDKADHQALEWLNRFGERIGLERREHIRSVVLRDCADAFEASRTTAHAFGPQMRDALRERVRSRRNAGGATLFDCLEEHLEGYAYVLTGECTVVWSDPPPQIRRS